MGSSTAPVILAVHELRTRLRGRGQHAWNVLSFILCRGCSILLFAASVPFFMRSPSHSQYGTIALLFNLFSYVTMLDLGLGYAVNLRLTRALARGRRDAVQIVAAAIPVFLVAGLVVTVATSMAGGVLSQALFGTADQAHAVRVLGATSTFILLSAVLTSTVQSYNRVDLVNLSRLILDVAKAGALVAGAVSPQPVLTATWVLLGGVVLKLIIDLLMVRRLLGGLARLVPVLNVGEVRINLRFGLPMAATSVVSIIFMSADRIYVSHVLGQAALVSYSIAADICSKAYFLVAAVTGSVYTLLIRRRAAGHDAANLQWISLGAVLVVALTFYLPLVVFAPELLSVWLGNATAANAVVVTRIWSLAAVAYLTLTVYYNFLQACGRPRVLLAANSLASFAMLSALMLMPTAYGIEGVGWIVFCTFAGEALSLWLISRRNGAS
jgi:O-antigen/teichoic acid export membrane protein